MRKLMGFDGGKFRERDVNATTTASESLNDIFFEVVDRYYAPFKDGVKRLARDAKTSPRTAQNWVDKQCTPRMDNFSTLVKSNRELRREVLRLLSEVEAQ